MSKKNLYLLGILGTIVIGSWLYSQYCCKNCCGTCHSTSVENPIPSKTAVAEILNFNLQNSDFKYSCNDNFNFIKDQFELLNKKNDCIDKGILELQKYFSKTPDARLTIAGLCLSSEKNNSAFPNLGFARANALKNYFIAKGIPSNRFDINGKITPQLNISNDTIKGPITYKLTNDIVTARGEDWEALKEKLNDSPLILYFNTNQTEIVLSTDERKKIADLVHYLDNVPSGKILCTGYTDNSGDRNVNILLGQKRAEFAKRYLIDNGINPDKIVTNSKGQEDPIADNLTPEGKAQNRRTVINIQ